MLEKFTILRNLNEKQIVEIEKFCEVRAYNPGDSICREGEVSDELYFLISGQVNLYKIEENTQNNLKFKEMSEGESFGEMSFVDGSPRSCSIEAATPNTKVGVLPKQKFIDGAPDAFEIMSSIGGAITQQVSDHLRTLSDRHIGTLQKQINELQERNHFASFLFLILLCLFLVTSVNAAIADFFPDYNPQTSLPFLVGYLIVVVMIPFLLGRSHVRLSFGEIGVTTRNFQKSLLDGIVFSIVGTLVFWVIAVVLDLIFPEAQLSSKIWTWPGAPIVLLIYLFHSYVQELLRGTVQLSIENFISNRKGMSAILITALLFGMFHVPYGTQAILLTLVGSIIFGFVYKRTYNLLGVSIVHFIFGVLLINMGLI
ncbi:MAG: cyclic nucleotide-binding domain-containing protein [Cyanobacteria bacterium SID2]|nr:cyclic nucleotide-binding domain-containing protein [Cyanobacteria bacterium SID2]MBP0004364.1 cyclic nucleotide-binding domain-containing protein [Cyanobacteria bacterium SBC]